MILLNTEYSWLPNSLTKGVKLPKIEYEPINFNYGGYYDGEKIVVVENEECIVAATIAHEFKHHLQAQNKRKLKIVSFDTECDYEISVRKYYRSSWSEFEALMFEHKYAKNWCNDWQLRKIMAFV